MEPLHRRRIRRHERGHGAPVPPDRRPPVHRDREAVRQHHVLLRQRRARGRPGEERRHDPRQARQPAHPADHRRARDVPQHARDAVLPDRVELLGHRQRQLHVQHRRRGRRAQPEQRRVLPGAARHAVGERLRDRRTERNLRHLQPAEARSSALHVRPDGEVHGPLRARALQPHPRVGRRRRSRQHVSRAAQPGRAEAVRQREHERLHLLQRHRAREQHEAAGHDLLPQRRQQGALREPVRAVDAELERAQGDRAAADGLPVRRHDAGSS